MTRRIVDAPPVETAWRDFLDRIDAARENVPQLANVARFREAAAHADDGDRFGSILLRARCWRRYRVVDRPRRPNDLRRGSASLVLAVECLQRGAMRGGKVCGQAAQRRIAEEHRWADLQRIEPAQHARELRKTDRVEAKIGEVYRGRDLAFDPEEVAGIVLQVVRDALLDAFAVAARRPRCRGRGVQVRARAPVDDASHPLGLTCQNKVLRLVAGE
jgi:hypothetical protein